MQRPGQAAGLLRPVQLARARQCRLGIDQREGAQVAVERPDAGERGFHRLGRGEPAGGDGGDQVGRG